MSIFSDWGKKIAGTNIPVYHIEVASQRMQLDRTRILKEIQERQDHLLHSQQSAAFDIMMLRCGGIGDATSAIAHKEWIVASATALIQMRDFNRLVGSPHAQDLRSGYHCAQALYLQKRLKQIEISICPEDFPKLLATTHQREQTLQVRKDELKSLLGQYGLKLDLANSFFSQSSPSFLDRRLQGVKDTCARLSKDLNQLISNKGSYDVALDPAVLAFIEDKADQSSAAPSPSGLS